MTKRDLFIILIKIFGLYWVIATLFSALPSNIIFACTNISIQFFLWLLLTVVVSIGLFYLLIYKAHKIVKILRLDKDFDDDNAALDKVKNIDLIKFSILIIGGFLILNNLPELLVKIFYIFKINLPRNNNSEIGAEIPFYILLGKNVFNILVGYFMLINFSKLANFLNKKIIK